MGLTRPRGFNKARRFNEPVGFIYFVGRRINIPRMYCGSGINSEYRVDDRLRMSAWITEIQEHVYRDSSDNRCKPDERSYSAPLAMLGELLAISQRKRRNSESRRDSRQHDMEQQEDQIQRLQACRSVKHRIADEDGPGHVDNEEQRRRDGRRHHYLLMRFPFFLNDQPPSDGNQYSADQNERRTDQWEDVIPRHVTFTRSIVITASLLLSYCTCPVRFVQTFRHTVTHC
jgi:hypothetical protein